MQDSPIPDKWRIGDYNFQRCPVKEITLDISQYIRAYNFYKNGNLPNAGGWLDQTAKFIDVVELIDGEMNAIMQKHMENMKRKGK
ncbi:MAG: hypothetical protein Q8R48_08085 [Candidatus Omnitrophota bacterium]|nr:hypothetical protein [Candidatus Omnitrophota bacterium]